MESSSENSAAQLVRDPKEFIFECDNGRRDKLDFDRLASFFKENGFLFVKKFFSDEEVDTLLKHTKTFTETESTCWYRYFNQALGEKRKEEVEEKPLLSRVEHLKGHFPEFDGIVEHPDVLGLMKKIWPGGCTLIKDKINMKRPGQGPDLKHQDIQAGWTKYAPDLVSMALFLDDNTKDNAAMSVMITGKHARKQLTKDFELLPNPYPPFAPSNEYFTMEGPRGSIILFDAFVPHGSPGNDGSTQRRNYFATWNPSQYGDNYDQYFADKLKNFPPNNMRDASKDYAYKA